MRNFGCDEGVNSIWETDCGGVVRLGRCRNGTGAVVDGPTKCEKKGHYRIGVLVESGFPRRNIQFRRNGNTSSEGVGVGRLGAKGYGEQRRHTNGNWRAKADQTAKRKRARLRTKVTEQKVRSKIRESVRES